jgi:hypothetical protein
MCTSTLRFFILSSVCAPVLPVVHVYYTRGQCAQMSTILVFIPTGRASTLLPGGRTTGMMTNVTPARSRWTRLEAARCGCRKKKLHHVQ